MTHLKINNSSLSNFNYHCMSEYYSFIGNNSRFIHFSTLTVEEWCLPLYTNLSIYVIVILSDDGLHNRPKHVVENIKMHSV